MSAAAISVLVSFLGRPKEGSYLSDGQLSFNCPRCREQNCGVWDNKYNLDITFPGSHRPPLLATCWKCAYASPTGQLVREYGERELRAAWRIYEESVGHLVQRRGPSRYARLAELPEDFERVREQSQDPHQQAAWHYLTVRRGVPPARVLELGFGISQEPRWVGRVLLPSYDGAGELNFVIGRLTQDRPNVPPYQTSFGVKRKDIIFHESRVDWNQPVLLSEGIFDVAAYPWNNIPLLGKSLPPGGPLEQALRKYRPPVILAVDMDAVAKPNAPARVAQTLVSRAAADREAILQRLSELGITERFWLELPRNDLGEVLEYDGAARVPGLVQAAMRADRSRPMGSI